jgi:hypothetical protein
MIVPCLTQAHHEKQTHSINVVLFHAYTIRAAKEALKAVVSCTESEDSSKVDILAIIAEYMRVEKAMTKHINKTCDARSTAHDMHTPTPLFVVGAWHGLLGPYDPPPCPR